MIQAILNWFGTEAGQFTLFGALKILGVFSVVMFIVAYAVDKVTKEPPEHIQHMVESVRIPRGSKLVDGAH